MKQFKIWFLLFIVLALTVACSNIDKVKQEFIESKKEENSSNIQVEKNYFNIKNIEHIPDTTGEALEVMKEWRKTENEKCDIQIDTVSLKEFWNSFKENINYDNKNQIIEVLKFPVHAIHPVMFRYAHDCDTTAYIENEKKYENFDIDSNNINKYYDFIFSDVLKKIISQTSTQDLLKKGIRSKSSPMLIYVFFPKDYNVKVNCPNDHNLKFYFHQELKNWKIGIGGF